MVDLLPGNPGGQSDPLPRGGAPAIDAVADGAFDIDVPSELGEFVEADAGADQDSDDGP
jgi:hypothetical protein